MEDRAAFEPRTFIWTWYEEGEDGVEIYHIDELAPFYRPITSPQDSIRFTSARIYEQLGEIDDSLRRIVFDVSLNNSHVNVICGEDEDRASFNVRINLSLPKDTATLLPPPEERSDGTKSKGSSVVPLGSGGDERNSNYIVKGVRFENVNLAAAEKTAQLVVSLYRRDFAPGSANNTLAIHIIAETKRGTPIKGDANLVVNCP